MIETLVIIAASLLILTGLIGVLIPILPDLLLIWVAALGYGLLVGWGEWGPWLFAAITLMGLAGVLAEVWVSGAGAKVGGASWWSVLLGLAVGLVGLVFFTPIGGLVGLLLGTFLGEILRLKDLRKAIRGLLGMGLGYGASFLVKLFLGLGMTAAWIVWLVVD